MDKFIELGKSFALEGAEKLAFVERQQALEQKRREEEREEIRRREEEEKAERRRRQDEDREERRQGREIRKLQMEAELQRQKV